MRLTRLYDPGPLAAYRELELGPHAAEHAARVLRLKAGDAIRVFDGSGHEHEAEVIEARRQAVRVRIQDALPEEALPRIAITLAQSIARAERMDYAVQKATELGASAIQPLIAEHGVVKLAPDDARKLERWRALSVSACEQCGRARLPLIVPPLPASQYLSAPGPGVRLLLAPTGGTTVAQLPESTAYTIAIGPEGGWSPVEQAAAQSGGWITFRLGPRTLRTETAGPAAIAALQAVYGEFRV
jgi:16S rRNA (uracil1498-N3)-methyltransferase